MTTQYDMLLKELEQLDQQMRQERLQAARARREQATPERTLTETGTHDDTETHRHRPMLSGGHGETTITEEQLQAI